MSGNEQAGLATSADPNTPAQQKRPEKHAARRPRGSAKEFTLNVLNGLAVGIVLVLLPSALIGGLAKALVPTLPWLAAVVTATGVAQSVMGLVVGYEVGHHFKLPPIQCGSIGLAVFAAAGAVKPAPGGKGFLLAGTGDIITMGLTAAVCVLVIRLMGEDLKSYSIIVYPTVLTVVGGLFGALVLGPSLKITQAIGLGIKYLTGLQPILLGILIAIAFAIIIMTPISSVGIGLAVSLAGIGAGAAAVGVAASGIGFCILGWKANGVATSLAHVIGSPKLSMPVMLLKPKIMLPVVCSAAVSGFVAVLLGIQGVPMSAGFGVIGLVGPLAHLQLVGVSVAALLKVAIAFFVLPISTIFLFRYVFKKVGVLTDDDYRLTL